MKGPIAAAVLATLMASSLGCRREPDARDISMKEPQRTGSETLVSWNDGPARKAIVDFVTRVTREGGPDFVPVAARIATFDNDGTLWAEQPMYVQLAFVLDRVKALAPMHPEWAQTQPFKAVLEGDAKALAATIADLWTERSLVDEARRVHGAELERRKA